MVPGTTFPSITSRVTMWPFIGADSDQVTINFFPLGTAERAVIELGVGENGEDKFSIVVRPLSGRVEMKQGEWRDADETVREDAEGEKI